MHIVSKETKHQIILKRKEKKKRENFFSPRKQGNIGSEKANE